MRESETLVRMHVYALIPLATLIALGMLVSAVAPREHEGQPDRLVSLTLLGGCVWALCQLLWNTTPDAGLAALYMRGSLLGSFVIAPAIFHLLVIAIGEEPKGFRRLLPLAFLYVWLYNAFPLIVVVAGVYVAARWLTERRLVWQGRQEGVAGPAACSLCRG